MNFKPCALSFGNRSLTPAGAGGLPSRRMIRLISAT
jgi:hypothetical protein